MLIIRARPSLKRGTLRLRKVQNFYDLPLFEALVEYLNQKLLQMGVG